ncbi:MAG TPA: hypothetical protein VJ326_01960 [Thermoplasmata archaeon]|nr:hypothetical protein [Thermoplasmata archaeon]
MQVGCGATTKEIHGRPYLYFWHYEDRGGRRVQVYRYIGAARSASARTRLAEAVGSYYDRIAEDLRRRRSEAVARAGSP